MRMLSSSSKMAMARNQLLIWVIWMQTRLSYDNLPKLQVIVPAIVISFQKNLQKRENLKAQDLTTLNQIQKKQNHLEPFWRNQTSLTRVDHLKESQSLDKVL